MPLSYLFIVNPNANSGKTLKKWERIYLPQIQKVIPQCAWSFTEEEGDAAYIVQYAKKLNFDVVVAVGGDGTINEVVNGLLDQTISYKLKRILSPKIFGFLPNRNVEDEKTPALGFIPTGTGCDFIKSIGIPSDFEGSLKILLADKRQASNIGKILFTVHKKKPLSHSRYFINIASCGITAQTVEIINQSKKTLGNKLTYFLAGLKTCMGNKQTKTLVYYDEKPPLKINLLALFVCNGKYCGAGMKIAMKADITDGLFNINEIKKISKIKTLLLSHRMVSGNYEGVEDIVSLKTAKKVRIEPDQEDDIFIECDGEIPGILPAEYTIIDKNIIIIC